jgi:hypothetical protein
LECLWGRYFQMGPPTGFMESFPKQDLKPSWGPSRLLIVLSLPSMKDSRRWGKCFRCGSTMFRKTLCPPGCHA